MNGTVLTFFIYVIGGGFVFLGLIGLVLPILQGVLFLLIGTVILSTRSKKIHTFIESLSQRSPKVSRVYQQSRDFLSNYIDL